MTAAIRTNRAAPITVARAGREGSPIPVTPTFSSRKAFGSPTSESRFGKTLTIGRPNPLVRTIAIGEQKRVSPDKATYFTNPTRANVMSRIRVETPYTSSLLKTQTRKDTVTTNRPDTETVKAHVSSPVSADRSIAKNQARELLKGKNVVTLFQRTKAPVQEAKVKQELVRNKTSHVEVIPPKVKPVEITPSTVTKKIEQRTEDKPGTLRKPLSFSEIGLNIALREKQVNQTKETTTPVVAKEAKSTLQVLKENEAQNTNSSLQRVRSTLRDISTKPLDLPSITRPIAPSELPAVGVPNIASKEGVKVKSRNLSPLEKVAAKTTQRTALQAPRVDQVMKKNEIARINNSVETPSIADKDAEKALLTNYLKDFVLTDHAADQPTIRQQVMHKEIAKRMAEHMTKPVNKDTGSQIEAQLLGDSTSLTEQIAIEKITKLVQEARATIQLAKLQNNDPEGTERKVMMKLHMKMQESGLLSVFTKIKTTVAEDLAKDPEALSRIDAETKEEEEKEALKKELPEDDEENEKETIVAKLPLKIELDTFADRFRRIFMKSRARRAFEKAQEKGFKQVTTGEIAHEIGTYQYTFIKSQPVRFINQQDGSITQTLQELHTENALVHSVGEAEAILDAKIDENAPVRITPKIRTQRRGLLDLFRVLGRYEELEQAEMKKQKKLQLAA